MSNASHKTGLFNDSDTWVGIALIGLGGVAAWMASDFDAYSRSYPLILSLLMFAFGALLVIKVAVGRAQHVSFAVPSRAALIATIVILLWIFSLSAGLGYLLPTFLMQLAFLVSCGQHSSKAVIFAAMISGVCYLAFIVGLGVRLPASLSPWLF